jgi:hypothetical protein
LKNFCAILSKYILFQLKLRLCMMFDVGDRVFSFGCGDQCSLVLVHCFLLSMVVVFCSSQFLFQSTHMPILCVLLLEFAFML